MLVNRSSLHGGRLWRHIHGLRDDIDRARIIVRIAVGIAVTIGIVAVGIAVIVRIGIIGRHADPDPNSDMRPAGLGRGTRKPYGSQNYYADKQGFLEHG